MAIKSFVTERISKHVVLQRMWPWDWMATSPYAVIQFVGTIVMKTMTVVQNRAK